MLLDANATCDSLPVYKQSTAEKRAKRGGSFIVLIKKMVFISPRNPWPWRGLNMHIKAQCVSG